MKWSMGMQNIPALKNGKISRLTPLFLNSYRINSQKPYRKTNGKAALAFGGSDIWNIRNPEYVRKVEYAFFVIKRIFSLRKVREMCKPEHQHAGCPSGAGVISC